MGHLIQAAVALPAAAARRATGRRHARARVHRRGPVRASRDRARAGRALPRHRRARVPRARAASSSTAAATSGCSPPGSARPTSRTACRCASRPRSRATRSARCTSTAPPRTSTSRPASRRCWTRCSPSTRTWSARRCTSPAGSARTRRRRRSAPPFDLPPDRAYAETCAAVASVMWNHRLLQATGEVRFADELERALYNGVLVGVALERVQVRLRQPAARPRRRPLAAPAPLVRLRVLPAEHHAHAREPAALRPRPVRRQPGLPVGRADRGRGRDRAARPRVVRVGAAERRAGAARAGCAATGVLELDMPPRFIDPDPRIDAVARLRRDRPRPADLLRRGRARRRPRLTGELRAGRPRDRREHRDRRRPRDPVLQLGQRGRPADARVDPSEREPVERERRRVARRPPAHPRSRPPAAGPPARGRPARVVSKSCGAHCSPPPIAFASASLRHQICSQSSPLARSPVGQRALDRGGVAARALDVDPDLESSASAISASSPEWVRLKHSRVALSSGLPCGPISNSISSGSRPSARAEQDPQRRRARPSSARAAPGRLSRAARSRSVAFRNAARHRTVSAGCARPTCHTSTSCTRVIDYARRLARMLDKRGKGAWHRGRRSSCSFKLGRSGPPSRSSE